MTISISNSNPISDIRASLVHAVLSANQATTQRERRAQFAAAFAYAEALRTLARGGITDKGIAGRWYGNEIEQARTWLGNDADLVLGASE